MTLSLPHGDALTPEELTQKLAVYIVTDERPDTQSLLCVVEQALKGGATAVQLRRKRDDGRRLVELGRELRRLTHRYEALYIVNDRVDIALLTEADGVHVGQSDISCRDVRRIAGSGIVGVSAATVDEARTAVADGADYLGVGAVFPTSSKTDADLCGLSGLGTIASQVSGIPIVAIGGISLANAAHVLSAGADGVAVVSAVMQAGKPATATCELARIVRQCQSRRVLVEQTKRNASWDGDRQNQ